MDDVIMLELSTVQQVPHDSCVVGNGDADGVFDCSHRGQSMGERSDPAGTLHEMMGISGIAPLKDNFDAAKHLPETPGIDYLAAGHLHFWKRKMFNR